MQYAYWRKPDSTPYKGTDERFAPEALFREIGKTATVDLAGGISWSLASFYQELDTVASASLAIMQPDGKQLNEADSRRLVREATHELIKKGGSGTAVEVRDVRLLVNKKAAAFFRASPVSRLLVTGISISACPLFPIDVFGTRIDAANRAAFSLPARLSKYKSYLSEHVKASEYFAVSVVTSEVSTHQAYEAALDSLNCLRGIWNMIATWGVFHFGMSAVPKRRWLGPIHLSPVQTFHDQDGNVIEDTYWYEPDYVEDVPLFSPRKEWADFDSKRVELFGKISASPFRSDLIKLVARYSIALDQSNADVALIMLWSLLERLTNTVGANYDETVDRVIWPFTDRDVSKQVMNQLRIRRNSFVHGAASSSSRDVIALIVKNFVDDHLLMAIENPFEAKSINEHAEYLSLPHSIDRLNCKRDMYSRALQFRQKDLPDQ